MGYGLYSVGDKDRGEDRDSGEVFQGWLRLLTTIKEPLAV
jgi:hypothetical protein